MIPGKNDELDEAKRIKSESKYNIAPRSRRKWFDFLWNSNEIANLHLNFMEVFTACTYLKAVDRNIKHEAESNLSK